MEEFYFDIVIVGAGPAGSSAAYEAAIRCYDMVLGINPKSTTALYNKSSSLVKVGRIGEGLQILSEVAKMDFSFKAKAKFDIDFAEIQENNEFKKIIL